MPTASTLLCRVSAEAANCETAIMRPRSSRFDLKASSESLARPTMAQFPRPNMLGLCFSYAALEIDTETGWIRLGSAHGRKRQSPLRPKFVQPDRSAQCDNRPTFLP